VVDNDRDLVVRIELEEIRCELLAEEDVDRLQLLDEAKFLKDDVDLVTIAGHPRVDVDHRMLACP